MPGPQGEPLTLFRTLVRDPSLAAAMRAMGGHLLRTDAIEARTRELVILRVSARLRCDYEWGVHVAAFSRAAGLSETEVEETTRTTVDPSLWPHRDVALLLLVDSLVDSGSVPDDVWAAVRTHWTDTQLLTVLSLAGWYHAICFVANGARLTREPWAPGFPTPRRAGAPTT